MIVAVAEAQVTVTSNAEDTDGLGFSRTNTKIISMGTELYIFSDYDGSGADKYLWRSTNGGDNWTQVGGYVLPSANDFYYGLWGDDAESDTVYMYSTSDDSSSGLNIADAVGASLTGNSDQVTQQSYSACFVFMRSDTLWAMAKYNRNSPDYFVGAFFTLDGVDASATWNKTDSVGFIAQTQGKFKWCPVSDGVIGFEGDFQNPSTSL